MKTYTVKNYKGNLVESLKKFSDSHKGAKIVEAVEENDELKIRINEADSHAKHPFHIEEFVKTENGSWKEITEFPYSKMFDNYADAVAELQKRHETMEKSAGSDSPITAVSKIKRDMNRKNWPRVSFEWTMFEEEHRYEVVRTP